MFEDMMTENNMPEKGPDKDDILSNHYNDQLQRKKDLNLINTVKDKQEQAKAEDERYQRHKAELEEADFQKENKAAIEKALKRKAEEERKRREEFYKKQEELKQQQEWENHKAKDKKGSSIFGMLKRTKEERDNDSLSRENEELRKLAFMDKELGIYNITKYQEDIKHIPLKGMVIAAIQVSGYDELSDDNKIKVLKALSDDMKSVFTDINTIYRKGENDFICLFNKAKIDKITEACNLLEDTFDKRNNEKEGSIYKIVSGISTHIHNEKYEDTEKRAYDKLNEIKNAVRVSDQDDNPEEDTIKENTAKPSEPVLKKEDKPEGNKDVRDKKQEKANKPLFTSKKKEVHHTAKAQVLKPIEYHANPDEDTGKQPVGAYSGDKSEEYAVKPASENAVMVKEKVIRVANEIEASDVEDMLMDMKYREKSLIIICIINQSFDKLFIINSLKTFTDMMAKLNDDIALSYIYAVYRNMDGVKYYMNKPDEPIIKNICQDIGSLYQNNKVVTGAMIANISNIQLFNNIYVQ